MVELARGDAARRRAISASLVLTGCAGLAQPPVMFVDGQPTQASTAHASLKPADAPCVVDDVVKVPPPPELHGLPPSGPTYYRRVAPGRTVVALSDATQIAVASGLGCAVTRRGRVQCWSLSEVIAAQGKGRQKFERRAALIPGIERAVSVGLGRSRACALLEGGQVACWGTEKSDGAVAPQRIEGIRDARSLSMMSTSDIACAVTARQTVACSGPAAFTLPEFPSGWSFERAVEHPSLTDVREVALAQTHYCVLQSGGRVRCFGFGSEPTSIVGAHQVVTTDNTTCVVTASRGASCFGSPSLVGGGAELATTSFLERPREVAGLSQVSALAAGSDSICALRNDGTARCWGSNATGGLGDGTRQSRFAPVPLCNARAIVQVAPGPQSCALFGDGSVRCWGDVEAIEYD